MKINKMESLISDPTQKSAPPDVPDRPLSAEEKIVYAALKNLGDIVSQLIRDKDFGEQLRTAALAEQENPGDDEAAWRRSILSHLNLLVLSLGDKATIEDILKPTTKG